MIKEHDRVALTEDMPEHGPKRGNIATVVMVHSIPGYELEFVTLDGETFAVISAFPHQVRAIGQREIAQARELEVV